jgi:putative membrane protein insertion efficiency factor
MAPDFPSEGYSDSRLSAQLEARPEGEFAAAHWVDVSPSESQQSSHQDHEHTPEPRLRDLPLRIENIPRIILLALIRLYQATFSRALPSNTCRFHPTCSHYGYQAIYKFGALKGGLMAAWRVLRCNPFNSGGFDPVP